MKLADRRTLAREYVLADPSRSDRSIAAESGLTRDLVSKARAALTAEGAIPAGPIAGRDGKRYAFARRGKAATHPVKRLQARLGALAAAMQSPELAAAWRTAPESVRACVVVNALALTRSAARLRQMTP